MAEGNIYQNTDEWKKQRLMHFTSSEVVKLMGEPKSKADKEAGKLSATAQSYVMQKLAEYATEGRCNDYAVTTIAMKWGNDNEQYAIQAYEERTGVAVEKVGFIEYDAFFGGSPDGLVGDDGIIEVKCPYDCAMHIAYCMLETAEDLKACKPEYYGQIQGNLLVTGRTWADFISYDPRSNFGYDLKVLRVERDDEFIAKMQDSLRKASAFYGQCVIRLNQLAGIGDTNEDNF